MMETNCQICGGHATSVHTLRISDFKDDRVEYSGHPECVNKLESKVKQLKNLDKLKVKDVIKKLKLKEIPNE